MGRDDAVRRICALGLDYDHCLAPLGRLSGGQRVRVHLLRVSLQRPDLLLLDEPTNYIDTHSAEVVQSELEAFTGCVVAATHDRYFLETFATRIVELTASAKGTRVERARRTRGEDMSDALEARYRARSLWLDGLAEPLTPRPALAGDRDCDVAIVGAGFTGCGPRTSWPRCSPTCASSSSSARSPASARRVATAAGPRPGSRAARTATRGCAATTPCAAASAPWPMRWARSATSIADEGIDCGWLHGGSLLVATSAPQVARLHEGVERRRAFGIGEDDLRLLEPSEIYQRVRVRGARAASFTPHCGRVDPARLARGLALACERRGVVIYEGTAAEAIEPGRVRCASGALRAGSVLRATEAFTVQQPGRAPAASCRSTR